MKAYLYLIGALVFTHSCGSSLQSDSKNTDNQYDLVIQDVKIFDSKNKSVLDSKTILIAGDSIIGIVDNSHKVLAKKRIEGKGRIVVPGFIDTHMHLGQIYGDGTNGHQEVLKSDDSFHRVLSDQFMSYGTTTILDMGHYEKWMDVSLRWQKNREPSYPNLFITSMKLISSGDEWPYTYDGFKQIMSEENARETVKKYAQMGIKYVKLYKLLREPEIKAVVDEAKNQKMIVFAHTDNNIATIPQAMALGGYDFEHFFTLVPSVLNMEEHWPKVKEKYDLNETGSIDEYAGKMCFFFKYIRDNPNLSNAKTKLLEKMAQEKVTISTAIHPIASAAGLNYPGSYSSWNSFPMRKSAFLPNYNDKNKRKLKVAFADMMQVLKEAHDIGVKIRIGTDCRYGGKAMLSELMLMAEANFEMGDILQIATWNGAEAMDILHDYGSIEKGKKADLVLFDKNPFVDYKNLIAEKTVIKGGKIFVKEKSRTPQILKEITQKGIQSGIKWLENIKENPIRAEEINEAGFELMKEGKISEAIAVFKYKDAKYKGAGNVYNDLVESNMYPSGYHLIRTGKIEDAILLYKYNIELFPESGYAHYILAETYISDGKKELAIPHYTKVIELAPESGYAKEVIKKLKDMDI